jgi:hypothetical protein
MNMKKKKPSVDPQEHPSSSRLEDMKMDMVQTTSLGRGRNNRDRNSVTFDRFVYTSNKSYQRLDGDDFVDVDAAEGAGGGGGNVTKNCSASSHRATSNKSKNFMSSNHLRALDNKQQPVIVDNKPKNVKFASTLDSKQPKQKQPVVKGETKTIRKDEDSAEDDVEVEVVIEEVSVRVPAKINVHERQNTKRNLVTTMQQLRRMRLLKQHHHHHPLIDDDDSDDDIVCDEEEEGDDDSLLGAKCETTDVLSSNMSNQRGAFSGVTFGNVKVGMGSHEVSDDDETMITTRTESPLSHEGGEELDDTLILEDVIVDIAESFRRFAMCEDLFNCGPQQQQQQKSKRRKVMMTTDDKKQQQHKNETSYCTCNEVLL